MFLYNGSNFEMSHSEDGASDLIAHSDSSSGARGDHIFLPGFLASRRAWRLMAATPHTRLITLIAASGKRSIDGGSGSSGKRRSGGGGAAVAILGCAVDMEFNFSGGFWLAMIGTRWSLTVG